MTHTYSDHPIDIFIPDRNQQGIHEFTLIPNSEKIGAQRILRSILWVFLPLCVSHLLLGEVLELSWGQYLLAQLPVLIILLNLYYFFKKRMKTPQNLQLGVEIDELCLKAGDQLLYRQKLSALRFQQLGWGMDTDDLLPAIRIEGPDFPKLVIGTTYAPHPWTNIQQSVEFTDYWLYPNDSWQKLKSLLLS
jgi:hypothetical protein